MNLKQAVMFGKLSQLDRFNFKRAAMFGLESRGLKKQFGKLFLVRMQSVVSKETRGARIQSNRGAMFGLDARIALAIFGALSVISGAALYSAIQDSKIVSLYTQIAEGTKAYESLYIDTGSHLNSVASQANLEAIGLIDGSGFDNWQGPYLGLEYNSTEYSFYLNNDYEMVFGAWSNSDWGLSSSLNPDVTCEAGESCSIWVGIAGLSDELKKAIDEKFDDGADSTGNVRQRSHIWVKTNINYIRS